MTLGTSSRYALYAVLDLARADESGPVSVSTIARRHRIPETALAKIFQRLVRSGLVSGVRGARGGYRLVRPPADVTVLEILNVFEPLPPAIGAGVPAGDGEADYLLQFFDAVDGQVRSALGSVTLDRLASPVPSALAS